MYILLFLFRFSISSEAVLTERSQRHEKGHKVRSVVSGLSATPLLGPFFGGCNYNSFSYIFLVLSTPSFLTSVVSRSPA